MKPIRFEVNGVLVEASHGESVLAACERAKIPLEKSCDGNGTCGTCRVFVKSGLELLNPPNEVEAEMIADRQFLPQERLSCQITVANGLKLSSGKNG